VKRRHLRVGFLGLVVLAGLGAGSTPAVTLAASSAGIPRTTAAAIRLPQAGGQQPSQRSDDRRIRTIAGLTRISVVGSTQVIVDGAGHTASVDANPYGVAIAPPLVGRSNTVKAGDALVANIGGEDKGTTVVRFPARTGPGRLFDVKPDKGTLGPANVAFNGLHGSVWVSNATGNEVQIFNLNGALVTTIYDALFNHPWGLATNQAVDGEFGKRSPAFFTSNTADATIDRIDIVFRSGLPPTFKVSRIGQLGKTGAETKIGLAWVPRAVIRGHELKDVLYAADPAANRVVALPNSSTSSWSPSSWWSVYQGRPLNVPIEPAVNPINGDVIVTDANDNNLVEIDPSYTRAVAWRQVDNAPVDLQKGNGSALIGLAATTDGYGNLVVYFSDDNLNSLNVLST
jgi:DNA-binding beta-propeller fold protein YncE